MHLKDKFFFLLGTERHPEKVRTLAHLPTDLFAVDIRFHGADYDMDLRVNPTDLPCNMEPT